MSFTNYRTTQIHLSADELERVMGGELVAIDADDSDWCYVIRLQSGFGTNKVVALTEDEFLLVGETLDNLHDYYESDGEPNPLYRQVVAKFQPAYDPS